MSTRRRRRSAIDAATILSGAVGVWHASDYTTSPRRSIPNRVTNPSAVMDPNIMVAPRRNFSVSNLWIKSSCTMTDSDQAAPDGSMEASTLTRGTAAAWQMYAPTVTLTAGTYTMACSVKWLGTGDPTFRIGPQSATSILKTADGTWQRFSSSFTVSAGTTGWALYAPVATSIANFAICDVQLFAGSSDLNTTWATLKPLALRNADFMVGYHGNNQVLGGVASGVITYASTGFVGLPVSKPVGPFTFIYVAKKNASGSTTNFQTIFQHPAVTGKNYDTFSVGPRAPINVGSRLSSTYMDRVATEGAHPEITDSLWGANTSLGPVVGLHRYDGATAKSYLNGVPYQSYASVVAAINMTDFMYGQGGGTALGWDVYAVAYWDRSLSDVECATAYAEMKAIYSITDGASLIFEGTSITSGSGASPDLSYPHRTGLLITKTAYGVNAGTINSSIAGTLPLSIALRRPSVQNIFTGLSRTRIVIVECGANDLRSANQDAWLADVAACLDLYRTNGFKVIMTTCLPGTTVNYNPARNYANPIMRGWVGVHCDAIADWAADATIGPDAAASNATYFADGIHPTDAACAIMAPIVATAIDSLL